MTTSYAADADVVIAFAGELRLDGDCENNYVLVRSWTATDCAGFTRTRQQILNVSDTTAPSLDIPADQTISCDRTVPTSAWRPQRTTAARLL